MAGSSAWNDILQIIKCRWQLLDGACQWFHGRWELEGDGQTPDGWTHTHPISFCLSGPNECLTFDFIPRIDFCFVFSSIYSTFISLISSRDRTKIKAYRATQDAAVGTLFHVRSSFSHYFMSNSWSQIELIALGFTELLHCKLLLIIHWPESQRWEEESWRNVILQDSPLSALLRHIFMEEKRNKAT